MSAKKLIRFDWAMTYILRNKANFDVLEAFLSNLLQEKITVLDILDCRGGFHTRPVSVDLKCKDSKGRHIIVEIQNQREVDYLQRLFWGTSKTVVESPESGGEYSDVVKVISISILYHKMHTDENVNTDFIYYGTTELYGLHTKKALMLNEQSERGELGTSVTCKNVFPEYYLIYVNKFDDMIRNNIDEWVYFFKHGKILEDFKSPGILLAAKKLDYLTMNEKERRAYDDYLAYLGQEIGILKAAKLDGIAEGKKEVAKKMKALNIPVEVIAEATGISKEEINNL